MATQRVYKYELGEGENWLSMPMNAEILSAAAQGSGVFIWAKLRPENPTEKRIFEVYGTGHDMPEVEGQRKFIGTALMHDGALVWHVFERKG